MRQTNKDDNENVLHRGDNNNVRQEHKFGIILLQDLLVFEASLPVTIAMTVYHTQLDKIYVKLKGTIEHQLIYQS